MLNHISLMGRLTADPDVAVVGSGISRASFTLAVNRDVKNKETGQYDSDFIDIVAWRGTADFVGKYFQKGQLVAVEGRLQIESYTDREGVRRRAAKVQAERVHFAEKKQDYAGNSPGNQSYASGFTPPPPPSAAPTYTPPQAPAYGGAGASGIPSATAPVYQVPELEPVSSSNGDQFRDLSPRSNEEDLPF